MSWRKQDTIKDQRVCVSTGVYIYLWVACRVKSYSKDCRISGWRFSVGTRFISPCSMNCIDVVFSNGGLLSVCGEKPIVLTRTWGVWGFLWVNWNIGLEVSFHEKKYVFWDLSLPLLAISLYCLHKCINTYIVLRLYTSLQMTLDFSSVPHIPSLFLHPIW